MPKTHHRLTVLLAFAWVTACSEAPEPQHVEPPPAVVDTDDIVDELESSSGGGLDTEPGLDEEQPPGSANFAAQAGSAAACDSGPTRILGRVTYDADFHFRGSQSNGARDIGKWEDAHPNLPRGESQPMPGLWVCAYDRDCQNCGESGDMRFDAQPFNDPLRTNNQFNVQSDDDLLGCARTDQAGVYDITVHGLPGGECNSDVYLTTWFCDGANEALTYGDGTQQARNAQVCVKMNLSSNQAPVTDPYPDTQGDWPGGPGPDESSTKYLWGRMYTNRHIWGKTSYFSWNLSCPAESAEGVAEIFFGHRCTGPTDNWEPEGCTNTDIGSSGAMNPAGCLATSTPNPSACEAGTLKGSKGCTQRGTANSNYRFNKEFVHMFRAAAQARPYFTPIRGYTTFSDVARIWPFASLSAEQRILDIRPIEALGQHAGVTNLSALNPPHYTDCSSANPFVGTNSCAKLNTTSRQNSTRPDVIAMRMHHAWLGTGVGHEMGHVLHNRYTTGAYKTRSSGSICQGGQQDMYEGWANFFGAAIWHPQSETAPTTSQDSWELERRDVRIGSDGGAASVNGCSAGTYPFTPNTSATDGREWFETQFFWDLYDDASASEPWDEADYSLVHMLKAWSGFARPTSEVGFNRHICEGQNESGGAFNRAWSCFFANSGCGLERTVQDYLTHLESISPCNTRWHDVAEYNCVAGYEPGEAVDEPVLDYTCL